MAIIIGSARIDERGKISGGAVGDQKQTSKSNDTVGEVSMQNFYVHPKGWYILRPINATHAVSMAKNMKVACNNPCLGYDQSNRLGVITYGINTKTKTECDCSSLVRACIKEATGKDPGNFNTANEVDVLEKSGLFEKRKAYVSETVTPLYEGDVLVTKSKGHTVLVTDGNSRIATNNNNNNSGTYFAKYTGNSDSIVTALSAVGCKDTSKTYRTKIAVENGISGYTGTAAQNKQMITLLKNGKLKKSGSVNSTVTYFAKYTGNTVSIITALSAVGCKDTSKTYRTKIAKANGISNYTGTAAQNKQMITLLKAGKLVKP